MKLNGKVALITGGGTGMGRAITLKLAAEGAAVAINYSRRAREAEQTVEAARRLNVQAFAMKADVMVEAEAVQLVERTAKQFGRLDVLVNNAGWSVAVPHRQMEGLTEEILERTWQTNVKGPIYVMRAAIPHMLKAGGGSIVNITSVAAFQGAGSSIIYVASKAALGVITKSLARAFGEITSASTRSRPALWTPNSWTGLLVRRRRALPGVPWAEFRPSMMSPVPSCTWHAMPRA
jgi:3-oxoacyl-[acyl-carrier protein] reductase